MDAKTQTHFFLNEKLNRIALREFNLIFPVRIAEGTTTSSSTSYSTKLSTNSRINIASLYPADKIVSAALYGAFGLQANASANALGYIRFRIGNTTFSSDERTVSNSGGYDYFFEKIDIDKTKLIDGIIWTDLYIKSETDALQVGGYLGYNYLAVKISK